MRTLCISHVKDIDGVSSAALVKAATGAEFRLTDYDALFDELQTLPKGLSELFLCDLGTDQSRFSTFLEILAEISTRVKLTYIDHHYLSPEDKARLKRLPITLVHNVHDCAGMLTYLHLKGSLPEEARLIALYAAVTDYMDDSTNAKRMMEKFDRHFVLLESTLLSYGLAKNSKDPSYARTLVRELAKMRFPHQIPGLPEAALGEAEVISKLAKLVKREGTKLRSVAYVETKEGSTGIVAKLVLGAFDASVGVSLRRKQGDRTEMSLRGTSQNREHLGKTIGAIAAKHGGSGGGHARAAGATIPTTEIEAVLKDLDAVVSGQG